MFINTNFLKVKEKVYYIIKNFEFLKIIKKNEPLFTLKTVMLFFKKKRLSCMLNIIYFVNVKEKVLKMQK